MIAMPQYKDRLNVEPEHDYLAEYYSDNAETFSYRRMVDWNECPHLHDEDNLIERKNIIRKRGRNSAYVKSMLFAEFQRGDEHSMIYSDDDIELMKAAMRGEFKPIGNDVAAGSDTSGGGDRQPMMVRLGTEVLYQERAPAGTKGIHHGKLLVKRLNFLGIHPWQLTLDGGGLGAEVANHMEDDLGYMGLKRAMANVGPQNKFEYKDKYSEIHYRIKELLSAGVLRLRWNDELLKQMRCRRFIEVDGGLKIKTERKPDHRAREKSSPDDLDTFVYTFYDFDWSILSEYRPENRSSTDPSAPTKFELEASRKSSIGGRTFRGAQNMSDMRRTIASDRKIYNMSLGRGR